MAREVGREVEAVASEDGIVRLCLCGHGLFDHAKEYHERDVQVFRISGPCKRCGCARVWLVAEALDRVIAVPAPSSPSEQIARYARTRPARKGCRPECGFGPIGLQFFHDAECTGPMWYGDQRDEPMPASVVPASMPPLLLWGERPAPKKMRVVVDEAQAPHAFSFDHRCACGHGKYLHAVNGAHCYGYGTDRQRCTCRRFVTASGEPSSPEWWKQFDRPQGAGKPEVH